MHGIQRQTVSSGDSAQLLKILPLFNGPLVKLRVASSANEYDVSVNLLSEKSSYFAKMFQEGRFVEGIEREATLEDMDGVVSPRSLENLLQWIYREKISFASTEYPDLISEMLEFLRMADMCDVHGMEQATADYLQDMLRMFEDTERPKMILPEHIKSTGLLPRDHPFRLAMAKGMMRHLIEDYSFPFNKLYQSPGFATDILKVARDTIRSGKCTISRLSGSSSVIDFHYQDPLFEKKRKIRKVEP